LFQAQSSCYDCLPSQMRNIQGKTVPLRNLLFAHLGTPSLN
jgi:hypothetical protein